MEPLVSIIVPVYNAQEYLRRCVDSVLAQEYRTFELILVDDGSEDGSAHICEEYAGKDERIRVIRKENTGVSDSRNRALDLAQGTYLQFLDSDDWLTADATQRLVRSALESGCDMVIADFYRVVGENISRKGDIEKEGLLDREEFAGLMMENPADFYYGVLWNKLYRRELIERHRLRMDADISWCEDFIFNLEYLRHCRTIYALQAPVYYYVKTKGSLVNSQGVSINNTIRMKLNVFEYYQQFYREVYDEESYEDIRFQVYRFLLAYAKDGFVSPSRGRKAGRERRSLVLPEALEGQGAAIGYYCCRKLWERCCEIAAIKNDMTLEEVLVVLYLNQGVEVGGVEELANLTGLSKKKAGAAVQKLEKREMVRRVSTRRLQEEAKQASGEGETVQRGVRLVSQAAARQASGEGEAVQRGVRLVSQAAARQASGEGEADLAAGGTGREADSARRLRKRYELLPEAAPVLYDLELAQKDFVSVQTRNFDEAERESYGKISCKIGENMRDFLRG